jgi:hypothetical protein
MTPPKWQAQLETMLPMVNGISSTSFLEQLQDEILLTTSAVIVKYLLRGYGY